MCLWVFCSSLICHDFVNEDVYNFIVSQLLLQTMALKGKFFFFKPGPYFWLKIRNSLVKVSILWTLFRSLEIRVYPYNWSETIQPLNKALPFFISTILGDE